MVQFGCQSITQKGCFPYDHDDSLCDLQIKAILVILSDAQVITLYRLIEVINSLTFSIRQFSFQ